MLRHELCVAIASNISNTIHCIHKCNVKLHELDLYVYTVSIIIVVTGPYPGGFVGLEKPPSLRKRPLSQL